MPFRSCSEIIRLTAPDFERYYICRNSISKSSAMSFVFSVGYYPTSVIRPRNSVLVKHIYVRPYSSIAPKCLFTSLSNANPPHPLANHTIFLQKFSNLINFHYLCGLFGKIYTQTKALNTNNLYNTLMYKILVNGNYFLNSLYASN